jgi:uncharacterized delta-60 repeat protein
VVFAWLSGNNPGTISFSAFAPDGATVSAGTNTTWQSTSLPFNYSAEFEMSSWKSGADEGVIVVWQDANSHIFAQRYTKAGATDGAAIQLSSAGGGGSVASLTGGGYVVTFIDGGDVKAQVFAADGTAGQVIIVDASNGDQDHPNIIGLSNGGFAVAWQISNGGDVYARLYDAAGSPQSAAQLVNEGFEAGAERFSNRAPALTQMADGSVGIAWVDHVGGSDHRIYITKVSEVSNSADNLKATGTITFADADHGDDPSASVISSSVTATSFSNNHQLTQAQTNAFLAGFSLDDAALSNFANGAGSTGWTYQAVASELDFMGAGDSVTLSFVVTIDDGSSSANSSAAQSVTITVNGSNDQPKVAAALSASSTEGDAAFTIDLLAGASDVDVGDSLSVDAASVSGLQGGVTRNGNTLSIDPGNAAFQSLSAGQTQTVLVSYKIADANGGSVSQSATVTITGVNDAPETSAASATGNQNASSITLSLAGSDIDGSVASFTIKSLPNNGTLYANAALTVLLAVGDSVNASANGADVYFVPDAGFSGGTSFTFAALDNNGAEDGSPATASITVREPPAATDVSATGAEDAASIAIGLAGTDSDGTIANFTIKSLPSGGTLYSNSALTAQVSIDDVITASGNAATLYFVPEADFAGTPSFTYIATDNDGLVDATPTTAQITVTAVNDAPTFGVPNSGTITTDLGFSEQSKYIALQPDGKFLVLGESNGDLGLVRYNADGTLDTSFGGGDGIVTQNIGSPYITKDIIVQAADGKIVVVGQSGDIFTLARYNADGTVDSSFSGAGTGLAVISGLGGNSRALDVFQQADGKLVAVGFKSNYGDFAMARLNADGTLDTSFGPNNTGIVTGDFGSQYEQGASVVAHNGGILVAGYSQDHGSDPDVLLLRYDASGSLDTAFNANVAFLKSQAGNQTGQNLVVLPDGKFLLTYTDGADFQTLKFNADGTLSADSALGGTVSFTEGGGAVTLDDDVEIKDAELEASNFDGATLTLMRSGGANAEDVFEAGTGLSTLTQGNALSLSGTVIGTVTTNSAGTLVLTFNANATDAQVNNAARLISYKNISENPPASVTIDWQFSDGNSGAQGSGGAQSASGTTTVNITAVNDLVTGLSNAHVLTLDGVGDYINVGDVDAADLVSGSFTVEAWFYWDGVQPSSIEHIVSKGNALGGERGWAIALEPKTAGATHLSLAYDADPNAPANQASSHVDLTGEPIGWHHVAMVYDSTTGNLTGYLNGSGSNWTNGQLSSLDGNGALSDDALIIGGVDMQAGNGVSVDQEYNGSIDEVRIWSQARSSSEINNYMNQSLTGNEQNLAGHWSMNGNANDSSAQANHGTLAGDAAFESQTNISVSASQTYRALLLGQDADDQSLTYSQGPNGADFGTVTVDGTKITYTHDPSNNADDFSINVNDGEADVTQLVTVSVV